MGEANNYYKKANELKQCINEVFVGKEEVVESLLICMLAGGHVLLEDVPGVGKTTLANTISKSIGCSLGRIQFTPDTLPGDILGVSVYNMKTQEFEYKEGVVMNQLLLADEINRTSPKTQASLLEAMAEGRITVDGKVYDLPKPFMVIATQNPVEFLGTYPLPEAQMDRFMMRLSIGYPAREQEMQMALQYLEGKTPDKIEAVCDVETILQMKAVVAGITVTNQVLSYIEDLVMLTREEQSFALGASPRAMLALVRAAQGRAFLQGRDYVKPDDVKKVAEQVLLHRISLTSEARIRQESAVKILQSLILKARIPVA
ncbi:MAG: MoxR family ATPase [Lachnospiraceae bacterium]|nr:MoxR family ATPase [Lachnospiraceae bacterium]